MGKYLEYLDKQIVKNPFPIYWYRLTKDSQKSAPRNPSSLKLFLEEEKKKRGTEMSSQLKRGWINSEVKKI